MVIFISGSVNSGKSTTSKLIAEKISGEWVDIDEITHSIPDFSLEKDIPRSLDLAVKKINALTNEGKTVVANYVLREQDYEQLSKGLVDKNQFYFTLAPKLEVARSDRGRGLTDWEFDRIKFHYDTGIANPSFGKIIDTSDMSMEQAADKIIEMVGKV